jgi:hypothetical protein
MAQRGTEGSHDLSRIKLMAVEAAVNAGLETSAQRLEEGRNQRRGADDDQRLLGQASCHGTHQCLLGKDETEIKRHQQVGQAAIDRCAVDDDIDVPQAVAQDGDTKGKDELLGPLPVHGVIDPHIAVDLHPHHAAIGQR